MTTPLKRTQSGDRFTAFSDDELTVLRLILDSSPAARRADEEGWAVRVTADGHRAIADAIERYGRPEVGRVKARKRA